MSNHNITLPRALSDEEARRAATMHSVYSYLLQIASRKEAASRLTCAGVSILRVKKMSPHGSLSRTNARSDGVSVVPAIPVMKARVVIGAD